MPTAVHESYIQMFQRRPEFVADVLRSQFAIEVPPFTRASTASEQLNDVVPTEYRADTVVSLATDAGDVFAVIIEVQLKQDDRKHRSWPVYVSTLHARLKCPVQLLVICPDQRTANWCAKPVVIGDRCLTLMPRVFGPGQMPVPTDLDDARRNPELATLSLITHGRTIDPKLAVELLETTTSVVDDDHAKFYYDLVMASLPKAVRALWGEFMTMTHKYHSDFARKYYDEGEAKGEARGEANAVLILLDARGLTVSDDARDRITTCTDLDQLAAWIRHAPTVAKAEDLFD